MRSNNSIVLLDDIPDIRELISTYLELTLPVRCLTYASCREMQNDSEAALESRVAILDLELGPGEPNGIDAFNWLISQDYRGKIFFLTGHGKSNPLVQQASQVGAEILEKPIAAADLSALLQPHLSSSEEFSQFQDQR